jgi:hypothetical protein
MGQVDYEEWFESVDIGSVPIGSVAYVVADLYRDLFEVRILRSRLLILDLIVWGSNDTASWAEDTSCQSRMADPGPRRQHGNLLWPTATHSTLLVRLHPRLSGDRGGYSALKTNDQYLYWSNL